MRSWALFWLRLKRSAFVLPGRSFELLKLLMRDVRPPFPTEGPLPESGELGSFCEVVWSAGAARAVPSPRWW